MPDSRQAEDRAGALTPFGVVLLLDAFQVEGVVYLPGEVTRFSEGWEALLRDPRGFVPVTDAEVKSLGGSEYIAITDFCSVRKSEIRAALPRQAVE